MEDEKLKRMADKEEKRIRMTERKEKRDKARTAANTGEPM